MKKTLIILASVGLFGATISNVTTVNGIKSNNKITQIYVLGDSLSDSNNLTNIFDNLTWNWHKVNFKTPFYNNSFTDGNTAAEIIAKKMGFNLTPAWETKTIGNNYAVAGARATKENWWSFEGLLINRATIEKQVDKLIKEHTIKSTDQFFLEIGGNDLIASLKLNNFWEQEQLINNAVTNEMNAIQNLINHGANHLIISNAPNISYIPMYNTSNKKLEANKLAIDFDNLWKTKINQLIIENPKVNLIPFDLASAFTKTLQKAENLGKNITQASIQYSIKQLYLNEPPQYINHITCQTINNDFFFDDVHPNKWGHQQLANIIYNLITK